MYIAIIISVLVGLLSGLHLGDWIQKRNRPLKVGEVGKARQVKKGDVILYEDGAYKVSARSNDYVTFEKKESYGQAVWSAMRTTETVRRLKDTVDVEAVNKALSGKL